jgi:hypothetical protein
LAGFQPALHPVAQEVDSALIEKHAALLIYQSLQKLQLRIGQGNGRG